MHPYREWPKVERIRFWSRRRLGLFAVGCVLPLVPVGLYLGYTGWDKPIGWYGIVVFTSLLCGLNMAGWSYEFELERQAAS